MSVVNSHDKNEMDSKGYNIVGLEQLKQIKVLGVGLLALAAHNHAQ